MTLEREAQLEQELAEVRSALLRSQRLARKKELATEQLVAAVYEAAKDAVLAHGPAAKIPAPKADKRPRPEAALVHLTDWQLGKRTETYNIDVCHRRVGQAIQKVIQITEIQRAGRPVNECHVMLGGDMVEGVGIFPGQAFEVEAGAFEQLISCAALIESSVSALLAEFPTVHVWEEIGNHGRLGRKGDHPHGDNIDRMAYTLARSRMTGTERLVWHPWQGTIGTHVTIGEYVAFLFHGDEIRSFGGNTPAFGILRKLTAWSSGVVDPFVDAYGGHFHTPMILTMPNAGRIFMTGSPESDNGYAKEFVAATGEPSQTLNFIDPVKGRVTSWHPLLLD